MITTASQAFMAKVNNGEIPSIRMQFVPASGTAFWLDDGDFWADSISFSEATSQSGEFSVGAAVIGSFEFTLNNFSGRFSDEVFPGAMVIPLLYYTINGEPEYLPKGAFYIASHKTMGNLIRCTAYDGMKLLDEHQTNITYPATVQAIVQNICAANAITLATATIPNGTYRVSKPDETLTDRQMLSYLCQITGNFAKIDENGHLVVGWYDFTNPVTISHTFDGKDLWTDTVTITGIKGYAPSADEGATEEDTYTYGSDDCLLVIEDNPYMTASNLETVCTMIGQRICGQAFRPGSLPILANPCIQAGDVLQITDNITHVVYLLPATQVNYTKSLTENVSCDFADDAEADLRPTSASRTRISIEQAKSEAASAASLATAASASATQAAAAALVADQKAEAASTAAATAEANATAAVQSATTASAKADQATSAALTAQKSADNANEYAARALGNLSAVQSVYETLTWITEHGTMTLTTDTALDPTHVYFVQDNDGDYTVGGVKYAVVTEPNADDLANYYVLTIDESLNNYVATHLAVDGEGLWVLPDSSGYKVLIATGSGTTYTEAGTYIIDPDGATVAWFGETVNVGREGAAGYFTQMGSSNWRIYQTAYGSDGVLETDVVVDIGAVEAASAATVKNFLSNGFRGEDVASGSTHIYFDFPLNVIPEDGSFAVCEEQLEAFVFTQRKSRVVRIDSYAPLITDFSTEDRNGLLEQSAAHPYMAVYYFGTSYSSVEVTSSETITLYAAPSGNRFILLDSVPSNGVLTYSGSGWSYTSETISGLPTPTVVVPSGDVKHYSLDWGTWTASELSILGITIVSDGQGGYKLNIPVTDHMLSFRQIGQNPQFLFGTSSADILGLYSFGAGENVNPTADHTAAIGKNLIAAYEGQAVVGKNNDVSDRYIFAIGNGSSIQERSNAFEVDDTGNVRLAFNVDAASTTVDGALYAAISALGWESEVID